ncbi:MULTISPECIES: lipoprotein [unclassified Methylophilus]|nr:lipoprotein [Methylophilus sp. 13]
MFASSTKLIALALLLCTLGACGLKGNLYLPERQYPQPQPPSDKSPS